MTPIHANNSPPPLPNHRPQSALAIWRWGSRIRRTAFISAGWLALLLSDHGLPPALAAEMQQIHGHVPVTITKLNLQPLGRLPATTNLNLAIGLPVRNPAEFQDLLQQIYDPTSPTYRHFLTPEQFTERFGPTESDYQAVIAFAKASGFTVTATHPNRLVLSVRAGVADIEKTFHLNLHSYQHPTENRTFYAPDSEPTLDLPVAVLHISNLDSYALPHPHHRIQPNPRPAMARPNSGSGPSGTYRGNDFRAAYVPGTTLRGTGQNVGLLQFDGYYAADIAAYISQAGITTSTLVTNIPVDGGVTTPGSGNSEVCLDIEMVLAMAPGVGKIFVYEAPNPSPWVDLLNRMANDNQAKQLSCSWGGGSPDPTAEGIFRQMAAQGQSFFNATGDSDAFTAAIEFPSDSTNVTEVGGTTLTTTGAGGSYVSETVWNWGGGTGSSGGSSTYYAIPAYQQGISMAANQGSTTMRNVPDVALTGDNVWVCYNNGSTGTFGGTSCAAPLWAGYTALINQQAVGNGQGPVGFLNPALYAIGKGSRSTTCFHDITTGNNFSTSSPSKFAAVTGYDLCTGWGTPAGTNLINALTGPVIPAPNLVASGSAVSGGNGNGLIDPNECNLINLFIQNIGTRTASNVTATLTTTTSGVTVTQPTASYANLAPAASGTNSTPFKISTAPGFTCGQSVALTLTLTYTGGTTTLYYQLAGSNTGYLITQATGASIVAGGTDTGNHADDAVTTINLPFGYTFYGQTFSNVTLSSNGNLQFGSSSTAYANACLPQSGVNNAIFAFWEDLRTDCANNGIYTSTSGVAPNRIFNIEWRASYYNASCAGATVNFEVRLYEGQTRFDILYGNLNGNGSSATVGVQKDTGSSSTTFECNTGGLSTGLRLTFQSQSCPDGGGSCGSPALPIISQSPQPTNVCAGGTALFSVTATGTGPFTYQWQTNNASLNNGGAYSGVTTHVLTVTPASPGTAADYRCLISNASGTSTSAVAALTVAENSAGGAATPATNAVCRGTGTTITLAGETGAIVKWQASTNNTTWSDVLTTANPYATTNLTTTSYFRAVVQNSPCGSATSSVAQITVNPTVTPTVSVTANPGTTICAGTAVTFTATPVNGGSSPTYVWKKKNGVVGDSSNTYTDSGLANGDTLDCQLISDADCATPTTTNATRLTMTVNTPPSVTTAPINRTTCVGTLASFSAAASSSPAPACQWQTSTNGGTTWTTLSGASNTTYSFTVGPGNDGNQYRAVFSNACGSVTSTTATLTIAPGQLGVSPALWNFGAVTTGATVQISWAVTNTGCGALSGTATCAAPFAVVSGSPFTLASAGMTNVVVSFTPPAAGGYSDAVLFTSNGGTSSNPVTGLGIDTLVANFTASPTNGVAPLTVAFTDQSTGGITNRYWDFGNGTTTNTTDTAVTNTYAVGTYSVTLIVSDAATATTNTQSNLIVVLNPPPAITQPPQATNVCAGSTASFTVTATGGGTFTYQWQTNNVNLNNGGASSGATANVLTVAPATAAAMANYRCLVSNDGGSATSTVAALTVTPASAGGTATPSASAVCSGTGTTLTLTGQTGAIVKWQSSTNNAVWSDIASTANPAVTGNLTATTFFRAVVQNSPCNTATSSVAQVLVNPTVTPSVSVRANPGTTICAGTTVTFTATPVNGGSSPSYLWKKNNTVVVGSSNTYTATGLANGDKIDCQLTSTAGCVAPATANAPQLTMAVTPVSVGGTATPSASAVCSGTGTTLTLAGQTGAIVKWQSSTNNATWVSLIATANPYATGPLTSTTYFRAIVQNSPCSTATSTVAQVTVNPTVAPTVTVQANPGTAICAGTAVTFTATPVNGGSRPNYLWKKNNTVVGGSGNTYTDTSLANGDTIDCQLTSTASCATTTTATAAQLTMVVTPVSVGGTATPSASAVCSGTGTTLTLAGQTGLIIQWQSSTNNAGWTDLKAAANPTATDPLTTTTYFRAIVQNSPCNSATSTVAQVIVNPTVTPLVSVGVNPGPASRTGKAVTSLAICTGTTVTFTATPVDGGSRPSYAWKKNGLLVGTSSNTYTDASLVNGDKIDCQLISSAGCATPPTADAPQLTILVDPFAVGGTAIPTAAAVCSGGETTVNLTGFTGTIQWQASVDNVTFSNLVGEMAASLPTGPLTGTTYYRAQITSGTCAPTTSSVTSVTVNVAPSVSTAPTNLTLCASAPASFQAAASGSPTPTIQWQSSANSGGIWNMIPGASNLTYSFTTELANDGTQYRAVFSNVCASVNSAAATLRLTPYSVTTGVAGQGIASGDTTTNCGAQVTLTATPAACYQFANWTEDGSVVSTATNYPFVLTSNRAVIANFTPIPFSVTTDAVGQGTTGGDTTTNCGTTVTLTATPAACYQFANWTENGTVVGTTTNYSLVLTGNRTLIANFAPIPYSVTTRSSPEAGGTTRGGGIIPCGSNVTVTATNVTPYQFIAWTENAIVVSPEASYSFRASTNRELVAQFDQPPVITLVPFVTNALFIISNRTVVVAGETNVFNVAAQHAAGNALTYQWTYGDGDTSAWSAVTLATHAYGSSNCGPYLASVQVSDGPLSVRSNLTVIAACELTITKLTISLNFARSNADSLSLKSRLNLPGITNLIQLMGIPVVVDVGDVQAFFTLNAKGRGVGANGTCVLAYTKPTKKLPGYWTATITRHKGAWRIPLAAHGLTNEPINKPGRIVTLPVAVLIGNEAFAVVPTLHYTATLGKTGTAK